MAAIWTERAIVGSFGKRIVGQIWAASLRDPALSASAASRRFVNASAYDKNVEEVVRPSVVPDDVIGPPSDNYWGPHPSTGVFGPAALDPKAKGAGPAAAPAATVAGGAAVDGGAGRTSVLDGQQVWFRPLEDVDKPAHA